METRVTFYANIDGNPTNVQELRLPAEILFNDVREQFINLVSVEVARNKELVTQFQKERETVKHLMAIYDLLNLRGK